MGFKIGDQVYLISDLCDFDFKRWAGEDGILYNKKYCIRIVGKQNVTIDYYLFPSKYFSYENIQHLF